MATDKATVTKIRKGDWIVVCDGQKALFLENTGDALSPQLTMRDTEKVKNPPTHVQGADSPGRTHQSVGPSRSSVEQTDWHDQAEKEFLDALAERLNRAVQAGEMRAIILVAPPRALGMIRPSLSEAVVAAIVTEIARDYVNLPVDEIAKQVVA